MINVIVHIKADELYMDDRVSKLVSLPYMPRIGEFIFLSEGTHEWLENKIMKLKDKSGYENWIFGINKDEPSVEDAIRVESVLYIEGEKYPHIEINR